MMGFFDNDYKGDTMISVPFELSVENAITILEPLAIFVLGMTAYSLFIYKFYRFLAAKDIFKLHLEKYNKARGAFFKKIIGVIFYILEYLILFPIFSMFWVAIITVLLTFLAKNQTIDTILLVSIAVVGAVRVTAYFTENLSQDLAKMLPFALLGVFLVDFSYFSIQDSLSVLNQVQNHIDIVVYYTAFLILMEFGLRVLYVVLGPLFIPKSKRKAAE